MQDGWREGCVARKREFEGSTMLTAFIAVAFGQM